MAFPVLSIEVAHVYSNIETLLGYRSALFLGGHWQPSLTERSRFAPLAMTLGTANLYA